MIWALGAVWAHTPHDSVTFVDVEGQRVLSDHMRLPERLVLVSEDGGFTWSYDHLPCDDEMLAGLWLDGVPLVSTASQTFLDEALVLDVGFRRLVRLEGEVLGAGEGGLWRSTDGVDWELWLEGDFVDVAAFEGQVAVATVDTVSLWDGSSWIELDPGVPVRDVALGEDGLRVASPKGLWSWKGSWTRVEEGDWAVVDDLGDGLVMATGPAAVYRSLDEGPMEAVAGIPETEEGPGNPSNGIHYFHFLRADDGAVWLASWEGLLRSEDEGATFEERFVIPDLVHRGIALEGALWLGGYGTGLVSVRDGERDLAGGRSPAGFIRFVSARGEVVAFSEKGTLYISQDAGLTWAREDEEVGGLEDASCVAWDGDTLLVGGADLEGRPVLGRWRGGEWSLTPIERDGDVEAIAPGLVVVEGVLLDGDLAPIAELGVGATDIEGGLISTVDGLVSTDGQRLTAFDGAFVDELAADGERLYALVDEEGLMLSEDGGKSWSALPNPDPLDHFLSVDAEEGRVAVAGYRGAWLSEDGGQSWTFANNFARIDAKHPEWSLDGWTHGSDPDADRLSIATAMRQGARARIQVWGEEFAVVSRGRVRVRADGELVPGSCARREAGWHEVEVEALSPGAALDGLDLYRGPGLSPAFCEEDPGGEPPVVDDDCGCGRRSSAGVLLLTVAATTLRRRR